MAFPPSAYTERGGVGTVRVHAEVARLLAQAGEAEADGGSTDAPQAHGQAAAEELAQAA
jgi:hypothetical protein